MFIPDRGCDPARPLALPVFFFHSASACSFPYDGGNSIVSAEFICAVVLFPPYLFSLHMWNQIDRTALELSQICDFSVANDGRRVNHGMKKATDWVRASLWLS